MFVSVFLDAFGLRPSRVDGSGRVSPPCDSSPIPRAPMGAQFEEGKGGAMGDETQAAV